MNGRHDGGTMIRVVHVPWESPETDAAVALRLRVFVDEQGFPRETEVDAEDVGATHFLAIDGDRVVATLRLFTRDRRWWIGRVAVEADRRGEGLGSRLIAEAERYAQSLAADAVRLSAQCQAQRFYERMGYTPVGQPYPDEHIQSITMEKRLAPDR